jgi:3-hydroxyisobutyrate dehydrogenase
MAKNLVKKGYTVYGFDVNKESVRQLSADGVLSSDNTSATLKDSEFVITMLPNTEIVSKHFRSHLASLDKAALSIDCSTIDPIGSRELSLEAEKHGLTFIDAPVSGGVVGAQNATLAFMVGAPSEAVFEVLPAELREPKRSWPRWARTYSTAKGTAEARSRRPATTWRWRSKWCRWPRPLRSAASSASTRRCSPRSWSRLRRGRVSSRRCWSIDTYSPLPGHLKGVPAERDYERGFNIELQLKDLGIALNSAKKSGAKVELGEHAAAIFSELCKKHPKKDIGYVYQTLLQHGAEK